MATDTTGAVVPGSNPNHPTSSQSIQHQNGNPHSHPSSLPNGRTGIHMHRSPALPLSVSQDADDDPRPVPLPAFFSGHEKRRANGRRTDHVGHDSRAEKTSVVVGAAGPTGRRSRYPAASIGRRRHLRRRLPPDADTLISLSSKDRGRSLTGLYYLLCF